jgi:C4-dicarboxylate transporter DctM subunit
VIVLVVLILLLAGVGMPLFAVLGGLTLIGYHADGTDLATMVIEIDGVASAPTLVAIPLFTFAGYVMAESKTPERLVRLARALVGWMPGGISVAAVVACAFFTAFTGASGVTIIALGGLLFPILQREGFRENFSLGLLTSGGSLGLLFPPSLPVILYGIIAQVDVDKLFNAALLPGMLLVAFMAAYSAFAALTTPEVQRHRFELGELVAATRAAAWELPLPVIILTGIYGGFLTANEAATVTVVIVLMVECLLYRDVRVGELPGIAKKSVVLVGAILLILGVALGLTNYLILEEVPDKVLGFIQGNVESRVGFLLALNVFLLVVGCLLDIFSAIIVVVPLIVPLANAYGVDPLHLGVIFLTNLEIGYLTPPVGMNLFLSSFRFGRPLPQLYVASLPFIGVLLVALGIITYVPELTLGFAATPPAVTEPTTNSSPDPAPEPTLEATAEPTTATITTATTAP